jgi:hypothetical protein
MPVEIRELVIKTEITSTSATHQAQLSDEQLQLIKQQIVAQCLAALKSQAKSTGFNR